MKRHLSIDFGIFLTSILWPFGGLIASIVNFRSKYSKYSFVIASAFFAYTIGLEGDLERSCGEFYKAANFTWTQIFSDFITLKQIELYTPLVTKFVSSIGLSYKVGFIFYMIIYSTLYVNIIGLLLRKFPSKLTVYHFLLFFGVATYFSFRSFISIRFSTALLLFVYSFLQTVLYNKPRYLLLCLLTPLIHLGFLVSLPVLPLYLLFKDKLVIVFICFILSFFVSQNSFVSFLESKSVNYEESVINDKVKSYASEEGRASLESRYENEAKNATIKLAFLNNLDKLMLSILLYTLIFLFVIRNKLVDFEYYNPYFVLCLFLGALSNIMMNISNGVRFLYLTDWLILGLLLLLYIKNSEIKIYKIYILVLIPALLILNITKAVSAHRLLSPEFFYSNFFFAVL